MSTLNRIIAKAIMKNIFGSKIANIKEARKPQSAPSNEQVLIEIKRDIEILKKTILEYLYVPLISLDTVFYNMFNEQVNSITGALVDSSANSKLFNDFWLDIYEKLYSARYRDHEARTEQSHIS